MLVHVRAGDRTYYYLARVENRTVTEFRPVEGPSAVDRTANVRTTAATVREVWAAEDRSAAFLQAVRDGRITVDRRGTGGRGGPLGGLFDGVAGFFSGLREALADLADDLGGLLG